MTAPANIVPPVVARYAPTLDALRPGCSGMDQRLRCGILYMRDRATTALQVAGWEAGAILQHVVALATVHAFAPMPANELQELHHSMTRLMGAAQALDMRGPRSEI